MLTRDAPDRFARGWNRLVASKGMPTDVAKMEVYFDELGDLPISDVEATFSALRREPDRFVADAGTIYARADTLAWESVQTEATQEARQLTAGRGAEEAELDAVRKARAIFVQHFEQMTGRRLAADHPFRTPTPQLPTYGCALCEDTAWVMDESEHRMRRCACLHHNPVFTQGRQRRQQRAGAK